jgi:acetyl esterase/lipase
MKRLTALILIIIATGLLGASTLAQNKILNVWPGTIPGAIERADYQEELRTIESGAVRIAKVTTPTLSIYFAPKEKAIGTAVIICPGGGYMRLAFQPEGPDVAQWLTEAGITGIVLKYRLPSDLIMENKSIGPLEDVQEAIRIVRRHAQEWGIDPKKIGVMGFSAGGHVASTASTHYNERVYESDTTSARPDFSLLIYPVISMDEKITHPGSRLNLLGASPDQKLVEKFSNELRVDANTPPAFLVCSEDDKTVPVQNSINYFLALKQNAVPCELHVYEKGGHGYGLAKNKGTESAWPEACLRWLASHGYR